ncbi:MAG: lipoprotein [Alphaproteobacteria bacterium]|nr:lipoprotein [Alphaproteobacteria bacterium]MBR2510965.1 lipoprotein [Alphaproteobacteria bacterium]
MKKIFIGFIVLSVFALSGCGVKSDLARPDPSFPRNYPIY